jgi:hypothetical protein
MFAAELAPAFSDNPNPPSKPVKLIFIHHSSGENWLANENGRLGIELRNNNYFGSDTNYQWGPEDQDVGSERIGDPTDIGHWYNWFGGLHSSVYLKALYSEKKKHCHSYSYYSRLPKDPGGENKIILFKSCFPNSNINGKPNDPPQTGNNPLRGQDAYSEYMTVANVKGIYNDLLKYFTTRQDKLFIVVTAPPLTVNDTSSAQAANARAVNNWLVKKWLKNYRSKNVAVFNFYNVLTSNGGNPDVNDLDRETGNHHRWWKGAVQHIQTVKKNTAAYPSEDSHPTVAGNRKAAKEFVKLLNVYYHRWQESQGKLGLMF